ncbi:efflux transporter outer membrane subunit [Luteimonas yindakuii]|uniref:efflux transporter outer membrane subunit n=1 Tax=Luteimonas yindakuii TaxID=2565782 RepID=UPI00244AEC38|nr:efflux transporter outer membrane subunit [Luteimonas yindakuii]
MMSKPLTLALTVALAASGCATLEPPLPQVTPAIPAEWTSTPGTGSSTTGDVAADADAVDSAVSDIGWRDFFADPRLQALIGQSLDHNRDLRVAVLNVERARAQYRIQRAARVPSLGAGAELLRTGGDAPVNDAYSVGLGVAGFELDLFGRVHNLGAAALQQYLATEEAQRSAQLALVAEVAAGWLTLAADQELLRIAEATLRSREASLSLAERRHALGGASALDVNQARTLVETARADAARYAGQVARDVNALTLLAGGPVDPALLPDAAVPQVAVAAPLPAGLPSDVLLRRPDIMAAEHGLRAANAHIGAARAAFFPSITLTGSVGTASNELSGLFDSGTRTWSFMPAVNIPIFQGGRLRAALGMATADRDIALAQYEQSIQAGFREVSDALALQTSLDGQIAAGERLLDAATRTLELSQARYDAGLDSHLQLLDAQRGQYAALQGLVAVRLAGQVNQVSLYKALGGGWRERGDI